MSRRPVRYIDEDEVDWGDDAMSLNDTGLRPKIVRLARPKQTPPPKKKQLSQKELRERQLERQRNYERKLRNLQGKRPTGNFEHPVDPFEDADGLSPDSDIIPTKPGKELKSETRTESPKSTYRRKVFGLSDDIQSI